MIRGKQVHHRRRVWRTDAEVNDRETGVVRRRLHRPIIAIDIASEPGRETLNIVAEIREQNEIAETIEWHARVTGEPIGSDFDFCDHQNREQGAGSGEPDTQLSVGSRAEL